MFNHLLNLLESYYVYLHYVCWVYLFIKSYKLLISCCIYKVMFVRLLKLLKLRFTHKFYYYVFILIELYFSNFSYSINFRPLTCFSVMIPEAV